MQLYDGSDLLGAQPTSVRTQETDDVDPMSEASVSSPCDNHKLPDAYQTNRPSGALETCFGSVGSESV